MLTGGHSGDIRVDREDGVFLRRGEPCFPRGAGEADTPRHLSFFASEMEDFEGFIAYHGGDDNPFVKLLQELLCTFSEEEPRLPFGRWQQVVPQFRDLSCKMMCMDPSQRITAREALQHPWFLEH